MSYMKRLYEKVEAVCGSCQEQHCEGCVINVKTDDGATVQLCGLDKRIISIEPAKKEALHGEPC